MLAQHVSKFIYGINVLTVHVYPVSSKKVFLLIFNAWHVARIFCPQIVGITG